MTKGMGCCSSNAVVNTYSFTMAQWGHEFYWNQPHPLPDTAHWPIKLQSEPQLWSATHQQVSNAHFWAQPSDAKEQLLQLQLREVRNGTLAAQDMKEGQDDLKCVTWPKWHPLLFNQVMKCSPKKSTANVFWSSWQNDDWIMIVENL